MKLGIAGSKFEAVLLIPEGWVVLSPWITSPCGHEYRHHILAAGRGIESEAFAKHLASELNRVTGIEAGSWHEKRDER